MLVCGEAGVGKSRLLAEFAALAKATGATVTQGACVELAAGGLPYSPMVGALGDLARNIDQATFDWLGESARAPLRRLRGVGAAHLGRKRTHQIATATTTMTTTITANSATWCMRSHSCCVWADPIRYDDLLSPIGAS